MIPSWLHVVSVLALVLGLVCAGIVLYDVVRRPQRMGVMNVVWPVTALFGTLATLWLYFRYGRLATRQAAASGSQDGKASSGAKETPFPIMVAKGALHCGSGCMIGDICAEWLAFAVPAIAIGLGWQHIFENKMFAVWILDFIFAFVLGIAFQYFAIVPMRHLGKLEGIWQAVKADTFSLTAWQVGMYGFMALASFWLFRHLLGARLEVDTPEFWFMMQLAMLCGFATSYPVNWWLIRRGIKEKM